jgi:hypothetical protein
MTRQYKQRNKHMDPISIIILTGCLASLVGLAFISGHELGRKNGLTAARICERNLANLRVQPLIERENRRAPRNRRARK